MQRQYIKDGTVVFEVQDMRSASSGGSGMFELNEDGNVVPKDGVVIPDYAEIEISHEEPKNSNAIWIEI